MPATIGRVEDPFVATFDHDGWTLAYEDVGSGPAVLLVHGLLMDRTMFFEQVEALADRYRVITPDLRGHGESEHRAQAYTQWDLMEDVAIDMDLARRLADGLPNLVDFVTIPRAGHSSSVEQPEAVTAAIERFLEGSEKRVALP